MPAFPWRERVFLPLATSQNLMVWSSPPEASVLPSGLKTTERTGSLWPWRVVRSFPVDQSQSLIVASSLPEASNLASGLKTTDEIVPACPPGKVDRSLGCSAKAGE